MIHKMKLYKEPFDAVKSGKKTIELRLCDEKRQRVKVGDTIEFTCTEPPNEVLRADVAALHRFDSFKELYENLPLLKCGYTPENVGNARAEDMDEYYSREEQDRYGVLGIEVVIG